MLNRKNGVPRNAVLASVAFGFFSVVLNYLWPDTVFLLLLNAVGSALLVLWAFITISQIRLRRTIALEFVATANRPWPRVAPGAEMHLGSP